MTGVSSTFEVAAALAGMERTAALMRSPRPLLRQIGVVMQHSAQQRFNTGTGPDGKAWAPLLPAYAEIKRGPTNILVGSGMAGGLQGSITFDTGADTATVGSNRIYAAVHQFGAVIRPVRAKALAFRLAGGVVHAQSVTIPARPYLGLSPADEVEIAELTGLFIGRLLRGG